MFGWIDKSNKQISEVNARMNFSYFCLFDVWNNTTMMMMGSNRPAVCECGGLRNENKKHTQTIQP